jgi:hypothetical protein
MELKFRIKNSETHQPYNMHSLEFDNGKGKSTSYDFSSDEKALDFIRTLELKNVYLCMELPENYIEKYNEKLANMNESQKNVLEGIQTLKHYIHTYDQQFEYVNYSEQTIIEDVIYGLGISIDKNKYRHSDGLNQFKQVLFKHIEPFIPKSTISK